MSKFVAIDTSSRHLTVVAVNEDKIVKNFIPDCALNHSVVLMGEIDRAMEEAKLLPSDCDFFCAVTGPGSFTGIRIGIATVKGLAMGAKKKMLSLTTFDLLAYNVKAKDFYAVVDAAHSHCYVCGYSDGKVSLPPTYMPMSAVADFNMPVVGFENLTFENYIKLDISDCLYPAVVANCDRLTDDIFALYVRKSQAEEGRK